MSAGELAKMIGKVAWVGVPATAKTGDTWDIACEIVDAREVWGEVQYQVRPTRDLGASTWVKSYRVRITEGVAS